MMISSELFMWSEDFTQSYVLACLRVSFYSGTGLTCSHGPPEEQHHLVCLYNKHRLSFFCPQSREDRSTEWRHSYGEYWIFCLSMTWPWLAQQVTSVILVLCVYYLISIKLAFFNYHFRLVLVCIWIFSIHFYILVQF